MGYKLHKPTLKELSDFKLAPLFVKIGVEIYRQSKLQSMATKEEYPTMLDHYLYGVHRSYCYIDFILVHDAYHREYTHEGLREKPVKKPVKKRLLDDSILPIFLNIGRAIDTVAGSHEATNGLRMTHPRHDKINPCEPLYAFIDAADSYCYHEKFTLRDLIWQHLVATSHIELD